MRITSSPPEESEPGRGWAYKNWLTMLAEDPAVPTAELGKSWRTISLRPIFSPTCDAFRLDLHILPELYAALESY
ncbi:hypothetical protein [Hominenteromicrobium sp.]|uniref:hypothetical protein n=1 Tax=Hominenteromicrobium sp. TaxID=3073581 RepID=UPI00399B6C39